MAVTTLPEQLSEAAPGRDTHKVKTLRRHRDCGHMSIPGMLMWPQSRTPPDFFT